MDKKETLRKFASIAVEVLVFASMFLLQFGTLGFSTAGLWASLGTLITTYVASVFIAYNEYKNGVMRGKNTEKYKTALTAYIEKANLSGDKKIALPKWCSYYTKEVKEMYQRTTLEDACIPYEHFNADYIDKDGMERPALKTLTKKQIYALLGKEKGKIVCKVKKHKIYELKSRDILDGRRIKSDTKTRESEEELEKRELLSDLITFFFFAIFTSVFVIVSTHGLTLATFGMFLYQCAIILSRGIMSHFRGYSNVTVNLVARMAEQSDYIDMFETWYANEKLNVQRGNEI